MAALRTRPRNPLFLTYPPILASSYRDKLIGACVVNPYDPTNDYSSAAGGPLPIRIRPQIDPEPVDLDNYYSVLNTSSNAGVRATFEKIVSAFFETDSSSQEGREAASAKWWKMETPRENLHRLMEDKDYRDAVLDMLRRDPTEPVYFVTNILVLSTLKMDKASKTARKAGVGASVPDPHGLLLDNNIVDVGGEAGHSTEGSTGGHFRHEMIVGLGVYPIYLCKPKSSGLKGAFQRKNPDPIILPVPISLRDLRMGSSLARPPDGAQFMSRSADKGDEEVAADDPVDFALYFPE